MVTITEITSNANTVRCFEVQQDGTTVFVASKLSEAESFAGDLRKQEQETFQANRLASLENQVATLNQECLEGFKLVDRLTKLVDSLNRDVLERSVSLEYALRIIEEQQQRLNDLENDFHS